MPEKASGSRLAFYGWTDYLLLNLVNTKESHFPNEPADLFVFNLKRVSIELIDAIKESQVFDNVYLVQPLHQLNLTGFADKLKRLLSGRKYYRHYAQQMESFVGSTVYAIFFTGAFWSETLHIVRYLFNASPAMEINFVEEGAASYADTDYLLRCMPRGGVREKIFSYMHYVKSHKRAKRQLNNIYLYQPKLRTSSEGVKRLLPISELYFAEQILRKISMGKNIHPYDVSKFFYCVSPSIAGRQKVHDENRAILEGIMDSVNLSEILVMLHPVIVGAEADIYQNYDKEMHVSVSPALIEAVFIEIDVEDKVLISQGSTVLITPKLMFDKEPFIIMTHRMYKDYAQFGNTGADEFYNKIYSLYWNKERLYAPRTKEEMREIISNLYTGKPK